MFRTPVRLNYNSKDLEDYENSEDTPELSTPREVLIACNSLVLNKTSPSPAKKIFLGVSSTTEICLRTEIQLIKNDLDAEKAQNQQLTENLKEKDEKIQKLSKAVNENKGEIRVLKHHLNELKTESELETKKLLAKIEVLKQENSKLSEKLNNYTLVETQVGVIQQELQDKYKKKVLSLKQSLSNRIEKLKKKEKDLAIEKSQFSDAVKGILAKFENLDTKIPGLKNLLW